MVPMISDKNWPNGLDKIARFRIRHLCILSGVLVYLKDYGKYLISMWPTLAECRRQLTVILDGIT
jgi:hypothetical protein